MVLILLSAALLLGALAFERVRLERSRNAIPLRVTVTGTRGKTTVTRILASVLREGGRTVLAKTTGSEPCLVLPDGSIEPIRRRGAASILEQIALLHRGARVGVDALVAEVMSIHGENHLVESRRILVPHVVLATNFRVDHTEAAGDRPEDVAALLALDVPEGATVFVPEAEAVPSFRTAVEVETRGGPADLEATRVVEVAAGTAAPLFAGADGRLDAFAENLDLVVAAARFLGLDDATIRRGVEDARHDVGALRAWRISGSAYAVNAFAANDPESTMVVHERVMTWLGSRTVFSGTARNGRHPRCVGLLSLRADRGDRTLQWADALASGLLERFDALVVTGLHAPALARRVERLARRGTGRGVRPDRDATTRPVPVRAVGRADAPELTRLALGELGAAGGIVFGFGNIGGVGTELVEHWRSTGEAMAHGH